MCCLVDRERLYCAAVPQLYGGKQSKYLNFAKDIKFLSNLTKILSTPSTDLNNRWGNGNDALVYPRFIRDRHAKVQFLSQQLIKRTINRIRPLTLPVEVVFNMRELSVRSQTILDFLGKMETSDAL